MTVQDAIRLLGPHLAGDLLILGPGQSVPVETFAGLFSDASGPDWYASLKDQDKGPGRDRGYGPHIERWRNEGLI